jgi:hypothetical protein
VGVFAGPEIVNDGLVLSLDAGNTQSYPGSGTTWFDISGGRRNYTFGSGIIWNSGGYFSCDGTGQFTGPGSNTFGFSSSMEHTIEAFALVSSTISPSIFFQWSATPNPIGGGDSRAIFTHLTFSNGVIYYDVAGCCGSTQRINYSPTNISSGIKHFVWRTRTDTTPNRQFFINTNSEMDSGSNSTNTATWDNTSSAVIGPSWIGNIYLFRAYNRALTNTEIRQNFNATRGRFGI